MAFFGAGFLLMLASLPVLGAAASPLLGVAFVVYNAALTGAVIVRFPRSSLTLAVVASALLGTVVSAGLAACTIALGSTG